MTESEIIKDKREELGGKIGDRRGQKRTRGEIIIGKRLVGCVGGLGTRGPSSASLYDLYMLYRSCLPMSPM